MTLFNRPPPNYPPQNGSVVVSPAEGTVKFIRNTLIDGKPYHVIHIFISIRDIHTQVYPVNGLILRSEYFPTRVFKDARGNTAENEHLDTYLATSAGPILIKQIAGKVARRIEAFHPVGTEVKQGQHLGRITLGSGCELYLPADKFTVIVKEGSTVKVGLSVVATTAV